jgi:hypothetical protein
MTTLADGQLWLRLGQADGSFGDAVVYRAGIVIFLLLTLISHLLLRHWHESALAPERWAGWHHGRICRMDEQNLLLDMRVVRLPAGSTPWDCNSMKGSHRRWPWGMGQRRQCREG